MPTEITTTSFPSWPQDHRIFDALALRRKLSINFKPNPFPDLCVVRSIVLAQRYGLVLDDDVVEYVNEQVRRGLTWERMQAAQLAHYGTVVVNLDMVQEHIGPAAWGLLDSSRTGTHSKKDTHAS